MKSLYFRWVPAPALVVQPDADAPPGRLVAWAAAEGVTLSIVRPYLGEALPTSTAGYSALIVLGGHMASYDDARFAWLGPLKQLIADAMVRERPFLGVCLGHQLAAVALGGVVALRPEGPARGMTAVLPTPDLPADPVFSALPVGARALQWNGDVVVDLPTGATMLTTDELGHPQTVRYGPRAWGVQCHPEVGPEEVGVWIGIERSSGTGLSPAQLTELAAELPDALEEMATQWTPTMRRFFALAARG